MRKPRAELFIERRKLVLYWLGSLALGFLIWWAFLQLNPRAPDANDFRDGAVIVGLIFCFITMNTWGFYKKSPHLKLYDDGVELGHLGFWRWDEIASIAPSGKGPLFLLNVAGRDVPKKWAKTNAYSYEYNAEKDQASVFFKFSSFLTNMPQDEFYKVLFRYIQTSLKKSGINKTDTVVASKKSKSFNERFWGVEKPTIRRKTVIILLLAFTGLAVYGIVLTRGFFPSADYMKIVLPVFLVLSAIASAAFYWANKNGKIKTKHGTKMSNSNVVLVFLLTHLFLWIALVDGAGNAYTQSYGKPSWKIAEIKEMKEYGKEKGCAKLEDLGDAFSKVCIQPEHINQAKPGAKITIYGKESWFGFYVEKYVIAGE